MSAYSLDLRQRIVEAYDQGEGTVRELAERFLVAPNTVQNYLTRWHATGTVAPAPHGGGPRRLLRRADARAPRALVAAQNDRTDAEYAAQLAAATGRQASRRTLCRTWRRLGFTRKKKVLHATEANMDAVAHAHGIFLGPIAMIASVAAWVCATTPMTEVAVPLTRASSPVLYRASVVGRFAVDGVADAGARLVVYDPRRAAAEVAARAAALVRYEAALTAFAARLNRQKLKTLAAITKALAALATRHGLAARYVVTAITGVVGSFAVRWQRADAALAAATQRDGRWPLVTNKPGLADADLCAWAVRRYKTHGRVERDMHLVKV